jgi:hypothetical protein
MDVEVGDLDAGPARVRGLLLVRAGVWAGLRAGLSATWAARRYVLLAYGLNLALALGLAAVVHDALSRSLGASLAAGRMRASWDSLWYASYATQASGPAATLRPSVSGIGAVLDALDAFLDGFASVLPTAAGTGLLPAAIVYLLAWTFLGGGFLATFTRREPGDGFLAGAARFFPRLLVLAALGLAGYAALLGPLRGALEDGVAARLHDVFDERVRFAWTLAVYAAVWVLVLLLNLVLDYARVQVVRADDPRWLRAPFAALAGAVRLVGRHPLKTGALYLGTGLLWLLWLGLYAAVVPGARTASAAAILGGFLLGQVYVAGRVALRCVFYASEARLCAALDVRD